LVEGAVLLVGAAAVFQFKVAGSLWTFAGAALLGASATTALAMVMASRLTHTGAMNGLSNLVMIPVMLLSGAWFSRRVFPQWLQTLSDYLPLTPLVEALRRIALEGAGWGDIKMEALLLIAYTVLGIALSSKLFKWY
jgi:ABC-2 type transport system permease protein